MLWNSNIVFLILCGLLRFGVCQGAEEEEGQEDIKSILQTLKSLDFYIRLQFEELESDQADISNNFADLRERLDGLNESHMALQGKVEEMDDRVTTKLGEMDDRVTTKLGEMDDRVTTKLGELHDRMIVMEGHMVELQASSKPDSILQTCVQSLEMQFQRMEQSLEGTSTKVSNLQELLTTDECATKSNDCSENASCKDAFVEYTCDCLAGYQGDGFTCEDVDECTTDNHRCHGHAHCNNSIGNYTCSCLPGFTGDGFHCEDVDECNLGMSECHSQAYCNNSIGNYTCSCLQGLSGDGFSCKGIPCVSPSHLIPTMGCITPVLEEMIWEDAKKNCLEQGGRLLEQISTQTEMNQLKEHFEEVLNTGSANKYAWIGMRGSRWIEEGDLLDASSPFWQSGQPNGGDTECVNIYLGYSQPVLYDNSCSSNGLHSLCQRMNPIE